jgi:hypothetical protein
VGNPVRLSGQLPDGQKNGLFAQDKVLDFLSQPTTAIYVIGVLTNCQTVTNNETGENVPVLKFRHVEVVDSAQAAAVSQILHKLHETRTGELALPFEYGEEVARPDRDFDDGGAG